MWLLRLLLVAVFQFIVAEGQDSCTERCKRIDTRSMGRIGFDEEKRTALFEKQRPLAQMKRICWRAYDYLDCMKKCPSPPEHVKFTKFTRNKCKFALRDLDEQLQCISRYHTFIRLRCSSFQKESVQQRRLNMSFTPSEESCRLLNLNLLCLENHIVNYCPRAKKIFTRYNFRDYFLNFVLPEDDSLFDEDDLDACQVAQQPDGIEFTDSIETTTDTTSTYDDYPEADTQFTPFPDLAGGTTMVKILPTDPGDAERARTEERQAFTELLDELITSTELNEFGKPQEPDEDREDWTEVPVIVGSKKQASNKKKHGGEIFIDVKSAEKNEDEQLPEHHEDREDTAAEMPMVTESHATVEMATESYEDLPTENALHKTKDLSAGKFGKVKDKSEEKIETQVEPTAKTERTSVLAVTEMINDTVVHHSNEGDEIFLDVNDKSNEKVDYAVTHKSSKEVHSHEKAPEPTPKLEVPELIFGSKEKADEGVGAKVDPIDHKANDEKYKLALNETMAASETEDFYDGIEEMTDGPHEATDELPTQKGKKYEKYETSPQINIVPIVTRPVNEKHGMNLGREIVVESSSPHGMITSRKKIFSGDHSLEDVPPNFMYSSSRGHYRTTPKYIADNTNPESSYEEFVPLEIDTSTLMGIENSTTSREHPHESTEFVPADGHEPDQHPDDPTRPMFNDKPVIKKILNWDQIDSEDGETSLERNNRKGMHENQEHPQESDYEYEVDPPESEDHPDSDVDTLLSWPHFPIVVAICLLILALFLCILIFICCRRKTATYDIRKFKPEDQPIL